HGSQLLEFATHNFDRLLRIGHQDRYRSRRRQLVDPLLTCSPNSVPMANLFWSGSLASRRTPGASLERYLNLVLRLRDHERSRRPLGQGKPTDHRTSFGKNPSTFVDPGDNVNWKGQNYVLCGMGFYANDWKISADDSGAALEVHVKNVEMQTKEDPAVTLRVYDADFSMLNKVEVTFLGLKFSPGGRQK